MSDVTYPLVYIDEEGTKSQIDTPDRLALVVEFIDDWDRPYECRDATGKRVRLIIWALQVILARIVPDDFDHTKISVKRFAEGDTVTLVEFFNKTPMRSLQIESGAALASEATELPTPTSTEAGSEDPMEFHRTWMRAQLGKRYS
ncbi:hypothetical protein [Streptomyces sp. NBC_01217]|uniref:hypothetical protein n=1 Tax=Streptomyces sp. NBC_01217 TaxID=2903779 RepID=UPI002E1456C6|nr:hypothetical protein OG507_40090 [Streptomyces sp. NBC_01217]